MKQSKKRITRGPIIKTDWVVEFRYGANGNWVEFKSFESQKQAAQWCISFENNRINNWPRGEARIIERKWRVVG